MWTAFVELIRVAILGAAHLCGGSIGSGVLCVSIVVRLALLPLTLRLARQARVQQARIAAIKPELEVLQRRYAKDQLVLMRETQALHAKHGIRVITPSGLLGMMIQLPLLGGLFAAVRGGLGAKARFLWIAELARPDGWLLAVVLGLTGLAAALTPAAPGQNGNVNATLILLSVGGTLFFLWSASSAIALSVGAGSLVSVLQNLLLAREERLPARV
ncbi:MAG: YidC/Oxa1 family membrane protein insertase [bacterium]